MVGSNIYGVLLELFIVFYSMNLSVVSGFHMTTYNVSSMCGAHINMKWKNIYTAELVISSQQHTSPSSLQHDQSDPPYDVYKSCDITVESWDFLNKLMVRFEEFNNTRSCSDVSLELLDGLTEMETTSIQGLPRPICGHHRENVMSRSFVTSDKYLTLRIHGDSLQEHGFHLRLYITAFQDGTCRSYEYPCANGRCIMEELACNGYNPCGDHSDCRASPEQEVVRVEEQPVPVLVTAIIALSVSIVVVIIGAVVLFRCDRLRRKRRRQEYTAALDGPDLQPEDRPVNYQRSESQIEADRRFAPPAYNSLPVTTEHLNEEETSQPTIIDDRDTCPDVTCYLPNTQSPPAYNCVMKHQEIFQVSQADIHVDTNMDDKT